MPSNEPFQKPETLSAPGEQVRRVIERLVFQANRAVKSPNPDAIHDLRVAIRRAEQAFAIFKCHLPRKPVKKIRKQLKPVLSAAGDLRDYDVALGILSKMRQPEAAELRGRVRARRKEGERSLAQRLQRLSLRRRAAKWRADLEVNATAAESNAEMLQSMLAACLPRLAQRFFAAGEAVALHHSGEKLHDFRIRAKKFRYTLELFLPVLGSTGEELIREVKSIQSTLGAMNDYRSVLSIAVEAGCGKQLLAALKRSERRKIRLFRDLWKDRFSRAAAARCVRALRAAGQGQRIARKPVGRSTQAAQSALAARA